MMNASQLSSLLSIITSFLLYINLNVVMVDTSEKFWFVRENSADVCELISFFTLAFSIPIGVSVVFGFKTSFISLGMLLACTFGTSSSTLSFETKLGCDQSSNAPERIWTINGILLNRQSKRR